ncbi:MAG TPA: PEP-CTERM sorting domain-containing protein [Burkholderiales bacterium]|nr:PEP-CTERM sorting domain-containing protein [Burkholderiales bacterium]
MNKKYWLPLVVAALLASALPAKAQTWDYHFGTQLSGDVYQPSTTFAHMSVSTTDYLSFSFVLRAFDAVSGGTLSSAFGSSAYIGSAIFNSVSGADPVSISNIQTNGAVGTVTLSSSSANVGGIGFDFSDCFGGGGSCNHGGNLGRLQSGEWVSWTLNFAAPQTPLLGTPPVALHVQSWGPGNENSGWYTPTTPVPEPETYAMLLAGLGLLALARKRRNRAAPIAAA